MDTPGRGPLLRTFRHPLGNQLRGSVRQAALPAAAVLALAVMMTGMPGVAASAGGMTGPSPARPATAMVRTVRSVPKTEGKHTVVVPPTTRVGRNPAGLAFDAGTHTLYVTNSGSDTVSVIDTTACNAKSSRTCDQHPHLIRLPAGADPQGVELDTATGTAYVADIGTNAISVIDTRTCNATDVKGCGQTLHSVKDPDGPINLGVDQRTDTVYVANFGDNFSGATDTVSVINGATCNAHDTSGCAQAPAAVKVPAGPDAVAVDQATNTVYVAIASVTHGPHGGTVSVIDGATCDGTRHAGCGQTVGSIAIAAPSNWIELDAPAHTLYTANNEGTVNNVSVINTATCDAARRSGCGQKTSTVPLNSSNAFAISIDQALHTVYVANILDDTVSVINESTCDAAHRSGCGRIPPTEQVDAGPDFLVTAPDTGTVYSANGIDNTVSVIDAAACDAATTAGCRHPAPTARAGTYPNGVAVDQAHHSVYITEGNGTVSVINAATCNTARRTHCRPVATVHVGADPEGIAVDQATNTVYVTDTGANTVSVINAAACNAAHPGGCRQAPPVVATGAQPVGVAVNARTDTVYVTDLGTAETIDGTVSVINGATCNGTHHAGCAQRTATIRVGSTPLGIAVNAATDTVYVANTGEFNADIVGDTVSVINGATCNGTHHAGCARTPATVHVGLYPFGVAIDQVTNTVYVANNYNDAEPATLSVIKGKTCDAINITGCARTPRVLPGIGRAPNLIVYDPITHTVDTTNYRDASVSEINVAHPSRTPVPAPRVAVGIEPVDIALDPADHTLYVTDNVRAGTVSILPE